MPAKLQGVSWGHIFIVVFLAVLALRVIWNIYEHEIQCFFSNFHTTYITGRKNIFKRIFKNK